MSLNPEVVAAVFQSATPEGRLKALQKASIEISDAMLARYIQFASAAITEGNTDTYMRYLAQAEGLLHAIDTAADAHRGANQFEGASRGGGAKRGHIADKSKEVLDCMRDALERHNGKSIHWAAQQARIKGLGSSVGANKKLWYRHR